MKPPFIIGIGSSKSGAGKTTFIEKFIKFARKEKNKYFIIAVKYTKTIDKATITVDDLQIEALGKDTERIKRAGADLVYWIKSSESELSNIIDKFRQEVLDNLLDRDKSSKEVIVILEGNSLVKFMPADVIIFLKSGDEYVKPSGESLLKIADIILDKDYSMEEVMSKIEEIQLKKSIETLLKERSNNGRITCAEARKIAEELKVPYIEVGRMANELKIKIKKCELGCF